MKKKIRIRKKTRTRDKTCLRKLYDLGSRLEITAERAVTALVKKLRKR